MTILSFSSKLEKHHRELKDDSHIQINAKRVACLSASTKPKKLWNSNSNIYATYEPKDIASQTSSKSICFSLDTKPKDMLD
jgi:hypothetical protein